MASKCFVSSKSDIRNVPAISTHFHPLPPTLTQYTYVYYTHVQLHLKPLPTPTPPSPVYTPSVSSPFPTGAPSWPEQALSRVPPSAAPTEGEGQRRHHNQHLGGSRGYFIVSTTKKRVLCDSRTSLSCLLCRSSYCLDSSLTCWSFCERTLASSFSSDSICVTRGNPNCGYCVGTVLLHSHTAYCYEHNDMRTPSSPEIQMIKDTHTYARKYVRILSSCTVTHQTHTHTQSHKTPFNVHR